MKIMSATKNFHVEKSFTTVQIIGGKDCHQQIPDLLVFGGARFIKCVEMEGGLTITEGSNLTVDGNLIVFGTSFLGNVEATHIITDDLVVNTEAIVKGNEHIYGNLMIDGCIQGPLCIEGDVDIYGNINLLGQTVTSINGARGPITIDGSSSISIVESPSGTFTWTVVPTGIPLANDHIWVGSASNLANPVLVTGDLSLTNTGATTLQNLQGQPVSVPSPNPYDVFSYIGGQWVGTANAQLTSLTLTGPITNSLQAATKAYVDASVLGLNVHFASEVLADSTNAVVVGATYANGTAGAGGSANSGLGVGATLTGTNLTGSALVIDGQTVQLGWRVLVNAFTGAAETKNGIYSLTQSAAIGVPWVLTRATDSDNHIAGQVMPGDTTFVAMGTVYAGTQWTQIDYGTGVPPDTIRIGFDNQLWTQLAGPSTGVTTWSAGSTGLTPAAPANGMIVLGGVLNAVSGGTGLNAYAIGDLLYANSATTLMRLPDVAAGSVLLSGGVGAAPAYGQLNLATTTTGVLPATNGGTGISTYTPGSLLVANTTTTLTQLPDVAVGSVLLSQGVGNDPSYGKVNLTTTVTGVLPVGNGGTGTSTPLTNGQLWIGSTGFPPVPATLTAGTGITVTNGAGSITLAINSANVLTSWSAGTTGLLPSSPSTGAVVLSGILNAPSGGTGYGTYAVGDLLVANTTTSLTKLSDVAVGSVLLSQGVGVQPMYGQVNLTTTVTGVLPVGNGGTGTSTALTNGELWIGSTGFPPVPATLTAGTGVTITNGPGSITLSVNSSSMLTSWSAGTTGLLPNSPSTGNVVLSGILNAPSGGTGYGTYAIGDILVANTTTSLTKLSDVAVGSVLLSGGVGAQPTYGPVNLTNTVTGVLPVSNGGTGNSTSLTNGQIWIGDTGFPPVATTLTPGTGIVITNGSGSITIGINSANLVTSFSAGTTGLLPNSPTTSAVVLSGILNAANGGTGNGSYTIGDLLVANSTTSLTKLSDVAVGSVLLSGGVGAEPTYGKVNLTSAVTGVLPVSNGGTGTSVAPPNGDIPIGNGTGYTVGPITAGPGISTTVGAGTLQINNIGVLSVDANGGTAETGALTLANGNAMTITDSPAGTFTFAVDFFPYTTTVTAASTTTLTESSTYLQYFTGTTTQTVVLPVTSTLKLGQEFSIKNNSTGLVTVTSSSGYVVSILQPNTTNVLTCTSLTGATAASWDGGNVGTFAVGSLPFALCFDGTNIWVANDGSNAVTKLVAATGAVVGTYSVGATPTGICFDGTNIWVANDNSASVTKLLASTGAVVGTYAAAGLPVGVCFDGNNIWVTNGAGGFNDITKLLASTGALVGNYVEGGESQYFLCFDGTNIWVANQTTNNVSKILAATGAFISTYAAGTTPYSVCFDGTNIWVTNNGSDNVTKLVAATGALVGTYAVGESPTGICFDGTNIWVANEVSGNVTKLLAATGANLGTYLVGQGPTAICFDGTNIWVTNASSNTVTKISQPNTQPGIQSSTVGIPLLSTYDNVARDVNANTQINNVIQGYVTNPTAAAIDYLSVLSAYNQYFTGTTTQTVVMPVTSTLALGQEFSITNNSTGLVTVTSSGSNVVSILQPNTTNILTCTSLTQTTAAAWSGGNVGTFTVGTTPYGNCFDGANIWVANYGSATVTKLQASTGALIGTYSVGTHPYGICFDGTNIWVGNAGSNNVTKLVASTGAVVGTYSVGTRPYNLCFDGTNIWVANYIGNSISKLLASTGAVLGTYSYGTAPFGICFDGTNVWVSNFSSSNVSKVLAATGALIGTYSVGTGPFGICFDGTNIWVVDNGVNTVTKLLASTGALIGTYSVGMGPFDICFDGTNIWVTNNLDFTVTQLLATTGNNIGTYLVGTNPVGICFDGANIWVSNNTDSTVNKITQPRAQPGIQSSTIGIPLLSTYDNVARDVNANTQINNVIQGYVTNPTAAGINYLSVLSSYNQYFTGTTTQTVVMPVTSTLALGQEFSITNDSTGLVTVTSSGSNVVSILQPNTTNVLTCTSLTQTTAAAWSGGNVGTFTVGSDPFDLCFDGTNMWVTNSGGTTVTKLLAATGAVIGTYSVGSAPFGICFDGTNMWVANSGGSTVTKLLAATGALIGTYTVGTGPEGICFDGTNVWVSNAGGTTVTKLLASTGALIGTYSVGSSPVGICFDGTNIWVANTLSNNVTKLLAATGALIGTYSVGTYPYSICFDGTSIWVANEGSANVTKLLATTGAVVGTYAVGSNPNGICFDGTNIWVPNFTNSNVTKLLATTGANLGTYPVGSGPLGICFDGANIWTANYTDSTVNKLTQPNIQPGFQSSVVGIPLLSTYDNVARDLNANAFINNVVQGYVTNATAAAIDYLSVFSSYNQFFTGSTTQTVVLPNAATTALGQQFSLTNNSTGLVSIVGANVGATVQTGNTSIVTCTSNASTAYFTGTASQTTTSISGTNTNWTSSMVGGYIVYANAGIAPITGFVSATSLTTTTSQTEANQAYVIYSGTKYAAGTVGQSTTTVTGSGTTFTAAMVGGWIVYTSGASTGLTAQIMAFVSTTSLTVAQSQTVAGGTTYAIYYLATPSWSAQSPITNVSTSIPALNYPNNYYASLAGVPIGGLYRSNFNSSITPVTSGVSIVFGTPATTATITVTGTPLVVGTLLTGSANIQQGTYILSQVSGTTGGTGVYNVTSPIVANTAAATVTSAGYILSSDPDILYVRTV